MEKNVFSFTLHHIESSKFGQMFKERVMTIRQCTSNSVFFLIKSIQGFYSKVSIQLSITKARMVCLSIKQLSHLLSQVGSYLLADSLGHTHGRHSSGLSTTHHAVAGVPVLMQVLGQLGGLPAARLPNNNHNAVVPVETITLVVSYRITLHSFNVGHFF